MYKLIIYLFNSSHDVSLVNLIISVTQNMSLKLLVLWYTFVFCHICMKLLLLCHVILSISCRVIDASPCRLKPDYKNGICYFSAKHPALSRADKIWLGQNQDNVSQWMTRPSADCGFNMLVLWMSRELIMYKTNITMLLSERIFLFPILWNKWKFKTYYYFQLCSVTITNCFFVRSIPLHTLLFSLL